jgi:MFS family permease
MATTALDDYRRIFGLPAFRRFWGGFAVSVLGDAMTRVALTWLVYDLTGSARALGWLMVCFTGPIVVGGLLAGWLLDHFERRLVMMADNLLRGAALALVPLLHAAGQLELWHIYLAAAVYGFLMMISLAGGPALLPALAPPELLRTANALEMLGFTVAGVLGPPLTGLLIGPLGAANIVVLDVASYAAFALALATIRVPQDAQASGASDGSLGEAVRLLRGNRVLLSTTLMFMAFNLGSGFMYLALPLASDRLLHGGPRLYGLLLGVLAAGEVAAVVAVGALTLPLALGALICLAQLGAGLSLAIFFLGRNVGTALVALFLYGVCSAPLTVWAQTLRMAIIPQRLRGRSFALLRTIMQAGGPLGAAIGGLLLPLLGVPAMLGLAALVVGAPGAAGWRVRALRLADQPRVAIDDAPASLLEETSLAGD